MADSGYLDFPTAVPPIAWDVHAVYTYYNGTWGITPRYTSCWNDVTATFRPLLMDKPMAWTRPDGTEDTELKALQRQTALGNLGIANATTESYGLVKYTDDWTDDGTGDPSDAPLTLTRHAIAGMLDAGLDAKQDRLTAGRGITISETNVISATGGGGGGGGDVTSDGDNDFTGTNTFSGHAVTVNDGISVEGGVALADGTPATTAGTLYRSGSDLKWGSAFVATSSRQTTFSVLQTFNAGLKVSGGSATTGTLSASGGELRWGNRTVATGDDVVREGRENYFTAVNWFEAGAHVSGLVVQAGGDASDSATDSGIVGDTVIQFVAGTVVHHGILRYTEDTDSDFHSVFNLSGYNADATTGTVTYTDTASLHVRRLEDIESVNIRDSHSAPWGDTQECLTNGGGTLYWGSEPVCTGTGYATKSGINTFSGTNKFTGAGNSFSQLLSCGKGLSIGNIYSGNIGVLSRNGADLMWGSDPIAAGYDVVREGRENIFLASNVFSGRLYAHRLHVTPGGGYGYAYGGGGSALVRFYVTDANDNGALSYMEDSSSDCPHAFSLDGRRFDCAIGEDVVEDNASLHVNTLSGISVMTMEDLGASPATEGLCSSGGTLYWNGSPVGGGALAPVELYSGITMVHGGRYTISADVLNDQVWDVADGAEAEVRVMAGVSTVRWPSNWCWADDTSHYDYGTLFIDKTHAAPSWDPGTEIVVKARGSASPTGTKSVFAHLAVYITPTAR